MCTLPVDRCTRPPVQAALPYLYEIIKIIIRQFKKNLEQRCPSSFNSAFQHHEFTSFLIDRFDKAQPYAISVY